jgi:hypothetical protein
MLVNIYKNWPNDVCACTMSMEDFMKMEGMLMEENETIWVRFCLWKWMVTLLAFRFFFVICKYDDEMAASSH